MDSPEYRTLIQCYPKLVTYVKQSPDNIVDKLRPIGIFTPVDLSFLSNPENYVEQKARKIIEVTLSYVLINPQVFHTFVLALEAADPWASTIISELKQAYSSLSVTTKQPSLERASIDTPSLDSMASNKLVIGERSVDTNHQETNCLCRKFEGVVHSVIDSLNKNGVVAQDLAVFLQQLEARKVKTASANTYLLFTPELVHKVDTIRGDISGAFDMLKGYYSWFDYDLIEDIIDRFCYKDVNVNSNLSNYKRHLEQSNCQHNFCEVPGRLKGRFIMIKLDREWATITIRELRKIKILLCDTLELRSRALLLRNVAQGCIELTFEIFNHVLHETQIQFYSKNIGHVIEQIKYKRMLDEMICDTKNTILLHYQKMHFIGAAGTGKSTTKNRLIGEILNLASLPVEERKHRSTYLAECTQILAVMDERETKLTLKVSDNHDDETRMLFGYLHSFISGDTAGDIPISITLKSSPPDISDQTNLVSPTPTIDVPNMTTSIVENNDSDQIKGTVVNVDRVLARLRSIVGSGKYTEQLQNKVLLNLIDVGGQPGFLEMLPFLSKGPGMFLAFFRLDKDLDELCEVSYERDEDKITPYKAIYTIRETLSQILSAINHHITYDQTMDEEHLSKLGDLASVKPIATLIGTFKDNLETKVKSEVLQAKLSTQFPKASEREKKEVIKHALSDSLDGHNPTAQVDINMQSAVNQWLTSSESFKKEVEDKLGQKLTQKSEAISTTTTHFGNLLFPPDDSQFIHLDNYNGKDVDMDPLREHIQKMFKSFFNNAKLRIRPSQLLLGVILRKEYDIVSIDDCICIGRALSMEEEEVRFSVWYLDRWVGALIYHPEIEDEDDWFKKNIICSPQVVFDSISSLIIESLLELHCPEGSSRNLGFLPDEKKNWREKGQFSLDTVKRCHSDKSKTLVKEGKLIPVKKLVKFLEYSNLLSLITTKKQLEGKVTEEVRCFIPAILECASSKELIKLPCSNADTPSPIKISFNTGYVPIGLFCALVSRLVSRGKEGILGMIWELVESGVKRNLVSFYIDNAENVITLVAHVECYEIRVIRQDESIILHDLCSYVLSTVLYVIKEISSNVNPIIAFDCQCVEHKSSLDNHLCQLSRGVNTCFTCNRRQVSLPANQECWFCKECTLGSDVSLEALPFAESDPTISFKWTKPGKRRLNCNENELILEKVTQSHCKGFYTCEILKNGKPHLDVFFCLRASNDGKNSSVEHVGSCFDQERENSSENTSTPPLKKQRLEQYSVDAQLMELCKGLDKKDIDKEVSDEHILKIYIQLENWKRVAAHLGLTKVDIKTIETSAGCDVEQMRLDMLLDWKKKRMIFKTATYQVLMKALIECGCSKSALQVRDCLHAE